MYGMSLDELIEFDIDVKEIQEVIDKTSEQTSDKIDWTKMWSKKYPVLAKYHAKLTPKWHLGVNENAVA